MYTGLLLGNASIARGLTCCKKKCKTFSLISQSLHLIGRRGTTDDVATIPFHPSLSSAGLRESPNLIPVHSLMLSSHLFFCLSPLLAPFTVPCCEPPRSSHGLCRKYSEVSYSISSQGLGSFFRFLLSMSSSHRQIR